MKARFIAITALTSVSLNAQKLSYTPDIVLGHRSYTYMHNVNYQLNERLKLNNLTLFDTEYTKDKENIFFIRNTLSYALTKRFSANAAFGMKNPGAFFSAYLQYKIIQPAYSLSYSIGTTYQKGFSLEQSISFEYTPYLTENFKGYFSVLAIGNLDDSGYPRGLQFIRLGVKRDKMMYGLASNFDQFNNGKKTLENIGAFVKYNF
ncbi:hypothetical protein J2795_001914 [Chryseobacterium bernardetii]|uniref:Outer membrane protein with beta-barrel domain n=2 Tax=Chryseobacterium TaxID=59732 RepID=A0A543EHS8_9FLAO|nr:MULTISPECIES: hypothetical protein [Chryseobacterium]MDR6371040.1 hypothetical protein [Chryseobacterium vietnamense]MDR6441214.1 hypothetical protein [Chryseobacterium bernardetii]TQM21111.1 hypothetical protein FB551_0793 [Chryseobacterium aquifrigidense]